MATGIEMLSLQDDTDLFHRRGYESPCSEEVSEVNKEQERIRLLNLELLLPTDQTGK